MPRARRPKPVRGRQHCRSAIDHPSAPQGRQPRSPGTRVRDLAGIESRRARRYSIEVKDAETGDTVILTTAEWTAEQKGLGVALIARLSGLPAAPRSAGPDEDPPAPGKPPGKPRYN